jgi:hypothetical protein
VPKILDLKCFLFTFVSVIHIFNTIGMLSRWVVGCFMVLSPLFLIAQVNFVAFWGFEGNRNGSTDNSNVVASPLNLSGINQLGFPAGATGSAVSLGGWSTTNAIGDYVEFSVTPQAYRISITSLSFAFNNTANGPTQLVVRSSADGFGSNIGASAVTLAFNTINIPLAYTDIETTTTFRIYGYSAVSGSGALRLDNLTINGKVALVPLPVELTVFKAQVFDKQININWQTTSERNVARFELQHSLDALEFITLTSVEANGDSYEQKNYTFSDKNAVIGTNYYRLRQTDNDGKNHYSKIISVIFDSTTPQIWIFQNITSNHEIKIRLQQLEPQNLQIYNSVGQLVAFGWQQLADNDYVLKPSISLPSGYYFLVGNHNQQRSSQRFLVMN